MAQNHVARVTPAVLPGTPKTFPISAERLIELAKKVYIDLEVGRKDPSILADNFRFEFPIIKLDKQKFLDVVKTFDFKAGMPDFEPNPYDWRVDKYEPNRVWFTIRNTGTHTGTLKVFKYKFKPTGNKIQGAPECYSLVFNEDGKVNSITGGYVMDNRVGNSNKLGGLYGTFAAIGVPVPCPQPGTWGWTVGVAVDSAINTVTGLLHWVTFGLFKQKQKAE